MSINTTSGHPTPTPTPFPLEVSASITSIASQGLSKPAKGTLGSRLYKHQENLKEIRQILTEYKEGFPTLINNPELLKDDVYSQFVKSIKKSDENCEVDEKWKNHYIEKKTKNCFNQLGLKDNSSEGAIRNVVGKIFESLIKERFGKIKDCKNLLNIACENLQKKENIINCYATEINAIANRITNMTDDQIKGVSEEEKIKNIGASLDVTMALLSPFKERIIVSRNLLDGRFIGIKAGAFSNDIDVLLQNDKFIKDFKRKERKAEILTRWEELNERQSKNITAKIISRDMFSDLDVCVKNYLQDFPQSKIRDKMKSKSPISEINRLNDEIFRESTSLFDKIKEVIKVLDDNKAPTENFESNFKEISSDLVSFITALIPYSIEKEKISEQEKKRSKEETEMKYEKSTELNEKLDLIKRYLSKNSKIIDLVNGGLKNNLIGLQIKILKEIKNIGLKSENLNNQVLSNSARSFVNKSILGNDILKKAIMMVNK